MRTSKIFVTTDAIIFRKAGSNYEMLFIKRKNEPFKGQWAIPGGFVDEGEDLEEAARRELQEETGLEVKGLEQLAAFGKPGRDPRQHTVSIAYVGFADENARAIGADDADEAEWFPVDNLPQLAFDHAEIVKMAIDKHLS